MKKTFKITIIALASLLLLLIILGGITQTQAFRDWLRDEIVKRAPSYINGELAIGKLEGNLLTWFRFEDVSIKQQGETVLSIKQLEIGLAPFESLSKRVVATRLIVDEPNLYTQQLPDSSWNVAHLVPVDTSTSDWTLIFSSIEINNGAFEVSVIDTSLTALDGRYEKFSANLRVEYEQERLQLDLRNLAITLPDSPLVIHKMEGLLNQQADSLRIKDLNIALARSTVRVQISVTHFDAPSYQIQLQAAPFKLDDWHGLIPNLKAGGDLSVEAELLGDMKNISGSLELKHEFGVVNTSFSARKDSTTIFYNVKTSVQKLNLAEWLKGEIPTTNLNFVATLNGSGANGDGLEAYMTLRAEPSRFAGYRINHLSFNGKAKRGNMNGELKARSSIGQLEVIGTVNDFQGAQNFKLTADARNLNLTELMNDSTFASNLNFNLNGEGSHFDSPDFRFDGVLKMTPSRAMFIGVDTLASQFHIRGRDIICDTLFIKSEVGNLYASGNLSLTYKNDFHFQAELGNLELVRKPLAADTLEAQGWLEGAVRGRADSLNIFGSYRLKKVKYNVTYIDSLFGDFLFDRHDSTAQGTLNMFANGVLLSLVPLDSARARIDFNSDVADIATEFWQGFDYSGEINGRYRFGEIGRFEIHQGAISMPSRIWETAHDSMWIDLGEDEYDFHNVALRSGMQSLFARGKYSTNGEQDLHVGISNIELASFANAVALKSNLLGSFDAEMYITGDARAPIINGHFLLGNGKISEFAFNHLIGKFGYQSENLSWEFTLAQDAQRSLNGEGYLPVRITFDDSATVVYNDRPIRIQAATTGLDLSFLQTFTERLTDVKGTLAFDVKIENTLQDFHPVGVVRVFDGAFRVPEHNTSYEKLRLVLSIQPDLIDLSFLEALNEKGKLNASGKVNIVDDEIKAINGSLLAKDFTLSNTNELKLQVDADIKAESDNNGLKYTGSVSVNRSRFFLQRLQERSAVLQIDEAPVDSVAVSEKHTPTVANTFLEKISGDVKIKISRNTWIKSPDVNLELEGELDFLQENEKYSLFGPIKIVRGSYELFGKRFDVQEGQITFLGDIETAAQVDLIARYLFREYGGGSSEAVRRRLLVKITGDIYQPTIVFYLDDLSTPLEEKDALSYLLFHVPGLVQGHEIDAATGLLTGLVSQQLTNTLGQSLNLDVISFQQGDNLEDSSVLVGKYIASNPFDIFISFSQQFGSFSSSDGRKVNLELELNQPIWLPFKKEKILLPIFIQATKGGEQDKETGFDLIWKIDW